MRGLVLSATLVALATTASAEVRPVPDRTDARIAAAAFAGTDPIRLEVPVGREVTVLLPAGETLASVSVASPGNWQVDARGAGDAFVVRPVRPVPDSTMAVLSSARTYSFVLAAVPSGSPTLLVRITAPATRSAPTHRVTARPTPNTPSWKLSGKKELWPSSIRDDGAKTYIEWPADQAIPAVFALDRLGREEMVNGYMRGTIFAIDRVHERLIFRIDKAAAEARRGPRSTAP